MEAYFIFSSPTMPHRDRALAAMLQIIPQRLLMRPRLPSSIGHADVDAHVHLFLAFSAIRSRMVTLMSPVIFASAG